jgi:hypothetical protein
MESARARVRSVLQSSEVVLEKQEDYEVWMGYAGQVSAEAWSADRLRVEFGEDEDRLGGVVAAAYYRSWFLESVEPDFQWQELLRTGGGLHFAEQAVDWEADTDPSVEDRDIPIEALGNGVHETGDFFRRHGYTVAYLAVERALRIHDLNDLPGLERDDVVSAVRAVSG